jgi:potassium-dependent mechanosensitive channel
LKPTFRRWHRTGVVIRISYAARALVLCALAWAPVASAVALEASPSPTIDKALVVLDGRPLFEVGGSGSWSAQQRAEEINCLLRDAATGTRPITLDLAERDGYQTIRLGDWHLLTVTDRDVVPGMEPAEQAQRWLKTIEAAELQARQERTAAYVAGAALRTFGALAMAAVLHWLLWQTRRRLPRGLARWSKLEGYSAQGGTPSWQLAIELTCAGLQALGWVAAVLFGAEQFPAARQVGFDAMRVVGESFHASLFAVDGRRYAADDILWLVAAVGLLWLAVGAFTRLLSTRLMRATGATPGALQPATTLVRYGLMFIGLVVILQLGGVNLSSLAILASVLGVGIGFGLQGIANNFVSGIIISFERPIKPGDFVSLGDLEGTVQRVGGRSTIIRTRDRVSIIVPNSRLLEQEVVNWSHGDDLARVHVPVGVAYGSDVRRLRDVLLDAAKSHPAALADPRPEVRLLGFGDSALNFELLVWSKDPPGHARLKSDLYYDIEANLRRAGIEIPFPQRTLHVSANEVAAVIDHVQASRAPAPIELYDSNGAPTIVNHNGTQSPRVRRQEDIPTIAAAARDGLDIDALVERMRAPGGLDVQDRRHRLSVYPKCFVGVEAVGWLMQSLDLTRDDAIRLGQTLVERRIVHHVLDEHPFRDGNYFYRFYADEVEGARHGHAAAKQGPRRGSS